MYELKYSGKFKKEFKKIAKQNPAITNELKIVLDLLIQGKVLGKKYSNHKLRGEFIKCYECHVRPDVLMIYKIKKRQLIILLLRIGSHSDLF